MRYQEALEKMPNATYFYEGVTQEEIDQIKVSKYEIEDDTDATLFVVGSIFEIEFLNNKKLLPTFGMKFG
jgi:hypothetical protein